MTGKEGEEVAAQFLLKQGYKILERNFRTSRGEIDIIARDGSTLVFIEVKARTDDLHGAPQAAVGYRKQIKLSHTALAYLSQKGIACPCRFDVVSVVGTTNRVRVDLFENAFEAVD